VRGFFFLRDGESGHQNLTLYESGFIISFIFACTVTTLRQLVILVQGLVYQIQQLIEFS
ncbi:hypothetical protein ACJX0J_016785, partial [Zea mays]